MKILAVTDLHGSTDDLEQILAKATSPDVIVLGGDLTNFGTANDAESIVQRCRERCAHVLAVAGNCDSPEIDRRLAALGVSLFRRGEVVQDVGFYGVSAMPIWKQTMYEISEAEIQSALDEGRAQLAAVAPQVIVSHPPPRGSVDRTWSCRCVGSTALRDHIELHQPALVICGHIHEGRGIAHVGQTTIVNCGPGFTGSYAWIELPQPVRVELRRA